MPNFSLTDQLNVTATSASAPGRRFAGVVGIKTDAIISYNRGDVADPIFNRVTEISADGSTLTLASVSDVVDVNNGSVLNAGVSTTSAFRIKSPKITNLSGASLYSRLPKKNISTVDLSNSNLDHSSSINILSFIFNLGNANLWSFI